jgi:hypothetical protein
VLPRCRAAVLYLAVPQSEPVMYTKLDTRALVPAAFLAAILATTSAHAALSEEDLAKIAQNPVGNLISVPFQENMNLTVPQLQLQGRRLSHHFTGHDRQLGGEGPSQQWTVPMGGGIGKIFHFGRLPVNTQLSAYYNVVRPDFGANWQLRA